MCGLGWMEWRECECVLLQVSDSVQCHHMARAGHATVCMYLDKNSTCMCRHLVMESLFLVSARMATLLAVITKSHCLSMWFRLLHI